MNKPQVKVSITVHGIYWHHLVLREESRKNTYSEPERKRLRNQNPCWEKKRENLYSDQLQALKFFFFKSQT